MDDGWLVCWPDRGCSASSSCRLWPRPIGTAIGSS